MGSVTAGRGLWRGRRGAAGGLTERETDGFPDTVLQYLSSGLDVCIGLQCEAFHMYILVINKNNYQSG